VKNAREVAERVLRRRTASIRALLGGRREGPPSDRPRGDATEPGETSCEAGRNPKREDRLARFERVRRIHQEGTSLRGIARALGMNFQTVQRYIRSDACLGS
jgi:DNA invertase Pin-like site-specific DNA recombinase